MRQLQTPRQISGTASSGEQHIRIPGAPKDTNLRPTPALESIGRTTTPAKDACTRYDQRDKRNARNVPDTFAHKLRVNSCGSRDPLRTMPQLPRAIILFGEKEDGTQLPGRNVEGLLNRRGDWGTPSQHVHPAARSLRHPELRKNTQSGPTCLTRWKQATPAWD